MKTAIAIPARSNAATLLLSLAGIVAFALLTAAAAHVRIPIPGTPVPVTLQTTIVLLAGLSLGAGLGAASMSLYLLLGAAGVHVFALQDATLDQLGWAYLWGPTGGYLLGFVLAQPVVGHLSRMRTLGGATLATLAGTAIIFASGLLWLAIWLGAGPLETIQRGLLPFILPGLIKAVLVIGIAPLALRHLRPIFGGPQTGDHVSN